MRGKNLVTGAALLVASALAGWLWQASGPTATFLAGAGFCTVAILVMIVTMKPAAKTAG